MPPFNVGFAQVEDRLRVVRRRINLRELQHALYLSGSLATLAAAVVVGVALRGEAVMFSAALWFAVASIAAALIAAGLRVHRRWVSVEQVVHFADRRAALDDRLATLLFDTAPGRSSPLKGLLLEQVLAATPRWDADTLVPRRMPRSALAFVASLIALIVVGFWARPPAGPNDLANRNMPHPSHLGSDTEEHPPPLSGGSRAEPAAQIGLGRGAMQLAGLTGGDRRADTSVPVPSRQAGGERTGHASQPADAAPAGDAAPANTERTSPHSAAGMPAMTEKLQSAIREALGAEKPGGETHNQTGSQLDDARRSDEQLKSGQRPTGAGSASRQRDASSSTAQPPRSAGSEPGGGSTAASGAREGGEPEQLFGSLASARPANGGTQNVSIKLGTFTALAPSQVEPQRHMPPIAQPVLGPAGQTAPQPLADEQVADAPLQKAEVAPEHEALVRRIFTRDE
jgi:hypothetical protein